MTLERKLLAGFAGSLLIVVVLGVLAFWSTWRFTSAVDWSRRSHEVIENLDDIEALAHRAESQQRDFLLTGDRDYLTAMGGSRQALAASLKHLTGLIRDNSHQSMRVPVLSDGISARLALLDEGVAAYRRAGRPAAITLAREGAGKRAMAVVDALLASMKSTEDGLLARRNGDVDSSVGRIEVLIGLLCAAGVLVAVVVFSGIFRDVSGRRLAEITTARLNRELETHVQRLNEANEALESFSYTVSHDLRAPLRSMDGFSRILMEDYAGRLDERGFDYLRRVRAASERMGRLIDDVLKLSRISRVEMRREDVDLSAAARAICAQLQASEPQRQADFEIQPGLHASSDPGLLSIVLENLIGNAWKFTAKQPRAHIKFGSVEGRPGVFFVSDNGAGFDMTYAASLFQPFRRLHKEDEFKGTGIGLATVQRIVKRHGGRAWADSQPGHGATFYFTLRSPGESIAASLPAAETLGRRAPPRT